MKEGVRGESLGPGWAWIRAWLYSVPALWPCQITSLRERGFPAVKKSDSYDHSTRGASGAHRTPGASRGVCEAALPGAQPDQPRLPAAQREVAQPLSGLSAGRAGVLGPGLISSG